MHSPAVLTAGLEQFRIERGNAVAADEAARGAIGRRCFSRAQNGYSLTADGADLLERARGMEAAARSLAAWASEVSSQSVVRIAAGTWDDSLGCQNFPAVNPEPARIRIVFEDRRAPRQLAYREADIGIRAFRPTETYLAARRMSLVAYALYCRRNAGPDERARMVAVREEGATISAYLKWPHQKPGDVIGVLVNRPGSLVDLARAGAGSAVLPCLSATSIPNSSGRANRSPRLPHEQWAGGQQRGPPPPRHPPGVPTASPPCSRVTVKSSKAGGRADPARVHSGHERQAKAPDRQVRGPIAFSDVSSGSGVALGDDDRDHQVAPIAFVVMRAERTSSTDTPASTARMIDWLSRCRSLASMRIAACCSWVIADACSSARFLDAGLRCHFCLSSIVCRWGSNADRWRGRRGGGCAPWPRLFGSRLELVVLGGFLHRGRRGLAAGDGSDNRIE